MKEGAVECKGCGNVYPVTQDKCEYCGRVNPARIVDPAAAAAAGVAEETTDPGKTSFDDIYKSAGGTGRDTTPYAPPPVPLDEIYPRTPPAPADPPKERVSVWVCLASLFLPFFGLFYFLAMRKKKKKTAVIALILCGINFISVLSNSLSNSI